MVGIEQFELGHARGASHDHSRIIRRSYHTPGYVELAGAAYDAWDRVTSDEPLVVRTGGIDLFPAGAAIPIDDYTAQHGRGRRSVRACSTRPRSCGAGPSGSSTPDVVGLFQADTGIVAAERATAALRARRGRRAAPGSRRHRGALASSDRGDGVVVATDAGEIRAGRVVLAADAWTNELLAGLDWQIPLDVTQEQLTYTRPADLAAVHPGPVPGVDLDGRAELVRLPASSASPGWVKTAQDCGGRIVTARTRTFDPDPGGRGAAARVPRATRSRARRPGETVTKTCLYTLTPDRDFVLDAVPGHPDVFVALGAAHGFKFAALFGEIMPRPRARHSPGPRPHARSAIDRDDPHDRHPRPRLARLTPSDSFGATAPSRARSRESSGGGSGALMTAQSARCDRIDQRDIELSADPIDAERPGRREIEHADPTEPIDRNDPTEPIDSIEPLDPIERNESSDHNDHSS